MGHTVLRAVTRVAIAALLVGAAPSASTAAATPTPLTAAQALPTPIDSPSGVYIVELEDAPLALYEGGLPGLVRTMPSGGARLDPHSLAAGRYIAFLENRQRVVAAAAGVTPFASYRVVLNGFAAEMSAERAAEVAASRGVKAVHADEVRHLDAVPAGAVGALGGVRAASAEASAGGAGIVVGVVDTGIAPDHPSFAGKALDRTQSAKGAPWLDGAEVVFGRANGLDFRAPAFDDAELSSKVLSMRDFRAGALAARLDLSADPESPRDASGHGSHVAATAAGNAGVRARNGVVDLGGVAGVAPDAKIASYKACHEGGDDSATDDLCVLSDVLAAVDSAVGDGVDVLAYAIGEGASRTADDVERFALLSAAVAGVFVATSAGNGGPDPGTAREPIPWVTTAAATSAPSPEATVRVSSGDFALDEFEAEGASATIPAGHTVSAPVVYAGDAFADSDAASASLCFADTLDRSIVTGRIVVCDRGTTSPAEKAAAVAAAGGLGMILVNRIPGPVVADVLTVPTVNLAETVRAELLEAVRTGGATASLVGGVHTSQGAQSASRVADFSGRGPADGVDLLTPDIAAPGAGIVSASTPSDAGEAGFGVLSGTSIAAAHVAGAAAVVLGETPLATPAAVASALTTTARDTAPSTDADDGEAGSPAAPDPFAQGAGEVDATRALEPGLVYDTVASEWLAFADGGVAASDLNRPSISIDGLAGTRIVTRTLTATRAGTYTAAATLPGIDVVVTPSTLAFGRAGEAQTVEVALTNRTAPGGQWTTGTLTWSSGDGDSIRSPLAARPVGIAAPPVVTGKGMSGAAVVEIPAPAPQVPVTAVGFARVGVLADPEGTVSGHSGDERSGGAAHTVGWTVDVPAGTALARWSLDTPMGVARLRVYHLTADGHFSREWSPVEYDGTQSVSLLEPEPGSYGIFVTVRTSRAMTWDATSTLVGSGVGLGQLSVPEVVRAFGSAGATVDVAWSGLAPGARYLAVVRYGAEESRTHSIIEVDAGAAPPVAEAAPEISGVAAVGETLTVSPGEWSPSDVELTYQWLYDGEPIVRATDPAYSVRTEDLGATISVQVWATPATGGNAGTAVSDGVVVLRTSATLVTMNRSVGHADDRWTATVAVQVQNRERGVGTVTLRIGSDTYTGTLADGRVTFVLAAPSPGLHVVVADYPGSDTVAASTGVTGFVVRG